MIDKFIASLKELYTPFGNEWVEKNRFVLQEAKDCGLALAGSIGGAVASKKAKKAPGDIDFVTSNVGAALRFVSRLQDKLLQYPTYWQIQANHQTKFCPDNCDCHFRFHAPFWLPICVFVLKDGLFRQWFTPDAFPVQFFGDIRAQAEEMEKRDGRKRVVNIEDPIPGDAAAGGDGLLIEMPNPYSISQ